MPNPESIERGGKASRALDQPGNRRNGLRRPSLHERIQENRQFFASFLRRPGTVGALLPSSRALALAMVREMDLAKARTVVELGPGTGAFTAVILDHLKPDTKFLAVEIDGEHCVSLRRRFAGLAVHHGSAENLHDYLRQHGAKHADCIISGLPWASLPNPLQDRLLSSIESALSSTGAFSTFAYIHARWLPSAVRFRERLLARFTRVEISPIVWKNAPPAIVYRCRHQATHRA